MKKIMIGVLSLIPIVILLVVQAVSVVVSSRTHIGVEEIILDQTEVDIEFANAVFDFDDYIEVSVLPERATDKTVTWSIADLECLDTDYAAKLKDYAENGDSDNYTGEIVLPTATMVDDDGNPVDSNTTGKFRLFSYCSFYVEAQAETMKARCLIYVGGYKVETIDLVGTSEISVGENSLLSAAYIPLDSIISETVWASSNTSVLKVDGNGGIKGVGAGSATVTVKAISPGMNDYIFSNEFAVTVTEGTSVFGSSVNAHQNSTLLSALGLTESDIDFVENGVVENLAGNDVLRFTNETQPAVITKKQGGTVTITLCGENEIKIDNAALYAFDENTIENFVLAVGEIPLSLTALWRSDLRLGLPSNVVWQSDRPSVASVDTNGKVTGHKRGIVTISATYVDGENSYVADIKLLVENKVSSLLLNITDNSLNVGLARETVFASCAYTDDTYSALKPNSVTVLSVRPKAPADETELKIYLDSFNFEVFEKDGEGLIPSDKAAFESNKLVFVPELITERVSLLVKVSAKYPKYETLKEFSKKEFSLNVTDGISIDSYACLQAASTSGKEICFVSDIKMLDGDTTPFTTYWQGTVRIEKSLWGNNCMFSAANGQMFEYTSLMEVVEDNVTVSNIRMRVNEVGDEITDANGNAGLTGKGIGTGCLTYSSGRILQNLRIEYCLIENGSGCLNVWGVVLSVEGCIFRNTSGVAVYVPTERAGDRLTYSYLTVTNCVMSNMVGTGFSFSYSGYSEAKNAESIARALADVAAGRNTTFTQKGFLDIYNWQSIDIMNLLDVDSLGETLGAAANAFARNEFATNATLRQYYCRYNGVDYFHMGFLTNGLTEPTYLEPQLEDKRFDMVTTEILSVKIFREAPPVKFWGYRGNETSIIPGKTYSVNSKLIAKLHGEY